MGSAGHRFIAHTKALSPAAQSKDGGYGAPPHPLTVRTGQCYRPRAKPRRPFSVQRVADGVALGRKLDGKREPVRISVERLLEVGADGHGRRYRFQGFRSRRYDTYARVMAIEDARAVLCFPEWHPRRPVSLSLSLVPREARRPGTWLLARADLSASSGARLEPSNFRSVDDPGDGVVARPDLTPSR